jgi:hypothetical protein
MTSETDISTLIIDDAPESPSALKETAAAKIPGAGGNPGSNWSARDGQPSQARPDTARRDDARQRWFRGTYPMLDNPVAQDIPVIFLTALVNTC